MLGVSYGTSGVKRTEGRGQKSGVRRINKIIKMKKKLLYITILTVIVLLQFLVVKQYIADRYYKSVKSEIQNPDLQNNKTGVSDFEIQNSKLKKAIHWDMNNPEFHYELAKLYERQMHQAAQEEGKWETFDNKSVFIEGEMSKHFEQLAIKEYYRAISLNPCVNYYHLDLAWLLKSKLLVGSQKSEVRDQKSEIRVGKRDNVSNIIKEFKKVTALPWVDSVQWLHLRLASGGVGDGK